jgi:hypothetical protein
MIEIVRQRARRAPRILWILVAVLGTLGCEPTADSRAPAPDTEGPRPAEQISTEAPSDPSGRGPLEDSVGPSPPADPMAEAAPPTQEPPSSEPLLELGQVSHPPEEVFGMIQHALVDPGLGVFVLDGHAQEIRWFGLDGRLRGSAGGSGDGPAEFRYARSLRLDRDGQLLALDQALRRIARFEPGPSGLSFVSALPLGVPGYDFCAFPEGFFVLAPVNYRSDAGTGLIHQVDTTGTTTHVFGDIPVEIPPELELHSELLQDVWTRGRLACIPDRGMLVLFPDESPLVTAFGTDGRTIWQVELEDYFPLLRIPGRTPTSVSMAPDPRSPEVHAPAGIAHLGGDTLALSIRRRGPDGSELAPEIRLLSLTNGRDLGSVSGTQPLIGTAGDLLLFAESLPFPKLTIERRRTGWP